jgi:hypothetical protein
LHGQLQMAFAPPPPAGYNQGMEIQVKREQRSPSRFASPLAIAISVFIAALATAYVAGYFFLGRRSEVGGLGPGIIRTTQVRAFRMEWQVAIYRPAANIESILVGERIGLVCWPNREQDELETESGL